MTHPTEEQRKAALEMLNSIVIAYCKSLGMDPPIPEKGSQTMQQYKLIQAALQTPSVRVIDGLESITSEGRTWYGVAGSIDPVAVPMKDFDKLMQCAREYLKLMNFNQPMKGKNHGN